MKNEYYLKKMYFNAGKTLLSENMEYCLNYVNNFEIDKVYEKFIKDMYSKNICFYDVCGAAGHILIKKTKNQKSGSNVFIFCDDEINNSFMGYFDYNKNLFIYIIRKHFPKYVRNVDISDCYYKNILSCRDFKKINSIAGDYLSKSCYLD